MNGGPRDDLRADCARLDGRPYPAYRDCARRPYAIGAYQLTLEHVQGDPFAAPSRARIDVPASVLDVPAWARHDAVARRATADHLHRAVRRTLDGGREAHGSGKSGLVAIVPLGQEILERTAVLVQADGSATLRLTVGLPAAGRRILGREAMRLLCDALPRALDAALGRLDHDALRRHVDAVEDQVALRAALAPTGLVAFVADGSRLARRSGVDDRPLPDGIPFVAPDALAVTLVAPHAGPLRGLGVRAGVTLVAGGGYHGKSTLLETLARGIYDHVPGDGRERCVTVPTAVTVRAEDGRAVRGVDLRPFIRRLPMGRPTERFDTDDASGSTSHAAAIVEAIEVGATALLIDEDTAATNFMIRDARMRRLVPDAGEPITPFIDRVRQLHETHGVSSILVVGGAGDYLDVADTVIRMQEYRPHDATAEAREIAATLPLGGAAPCAPDVWPLANARVPDPTSLDPRRGQRERIRAVRTRAIEFGDDEIDVSLLAQLVDPAQCRAIGDVLAVLGRLADGRRSMPDLLVALEAQIDAEGLLGVTAPTFGDRARPRRFEIAATLNRLRALRLR